jgi:hypothetical protein
MLSKIMVHIVERHYSAQVAVTSDPGCGRLGSDSELACRITDSYFFWFFFLFRRLSAVFVGARSAVSFSEPAALPQATEPPTP